MSAATYQGTPCKRGHDGTRYVASNHCVACESARTQSKAPVRVARRPLELVAIVSRQEADLHVSVAATISTADGLRREVFEADETPSGLISALREVIDWLERDYVEVVEEAAA